MDNVDVNNIVALIRGEQEELQEIPRDDGLQRQDKNAIEEQPLNQ